MRAYASFSCVETLLLVLAKLGFELRVLVFPPFLQSLDEGEESFRNIHAVGADVAAGGKEARAGAIISNSASSTVRRANGDVRSST